MANDGSKNVQVTPDQIVQDAVDMGMNFELTPKTPGVQNPQQPQNQAVVDPGVVQDPEQRPMNVIPQSALPPQQEPGGEQPQSPGTTEQQPYFQTPNSTYWTEEQMKGALLEKDRYISELHAMRNQTPQQPQVQAPAPAPPQKTKEQLDAEFDNFRETHGDREAMMIMAENIADQKLADRDRQTVQHRAETQNFVDDFRRRNPHVSEAQIQAMKNRYEELYNQPNFNPIDVLYNPGTQQPQPNYPGGGNGNPPVYPTNTAPYPGQYPNPAVINQDNQQYRQQVDSMRKNFIPRSPQTVSQADNQLGQANENLRNKVNAGDIEGATFAAFERSAINSHIRAGRGR